MLQAVERLTSEAADITTSVRDLPTVRTPLGRARAWLRLALMQKKLPDYVRLLLENQQVLQEHYEPGALMLSEEAIHVLGLLVGLNVIDCNLCMKVSCRCRCRRVPGRSVVIVPGAAAGGGWNLECYCFCNFDLLQALVL